MINSSSFTSASTIPAKLFCDPDLVPAISKKHIKPVHIQVNPTNKCPLNCSFCSCKNRNKDLELPIDTLINATEKFIKLGTKAVTITGGGDPLAYEHLSDYIRYLRSKDVKVGFVTNGVLFKQTDTDFFKYVTWCRVSLSDEYKLINPKLEHIVSNTPIDWSFSYVLCPSTKIENLVAAINFANGHKFTHVRIVDDILNTTVSKIDTIRDQLHHLTDDKIVIYQGRKTYTRGHKRCLISLLKPNIGPNGYIYACCGIQYAKNPPSLDFSLQDAMGGLDDIERLWKNQDSYNGSDCEKCYYSDYNNVLNTIWDSADLNHKEFI